MAAHKADNPATARERAKAVVNVYLELLTATAVKARPSHADKLLRALSVQYEDFTDTELSWEGPNEVVDGLDGYFNGGEERPIEILLAIGKDLNKPPKPARVKSSRVK